MSVSKKKMIKVRRKHVHWYDVLFEIGDLKMCADFWLFKQSHQKWSNDRIAWNILKRYYSTTTLAQMRYEYGV